MKWADSVGTLNRVHADPLSGALTLHDSAGLCTQSFFGVFGPRHSQQCCSFQRELGFPSRGSVRPGKADIQQGITL